MMHSAEAGVGQKIRRFREKEGLSQAQVAKKLGLNRVSYTQLEKGCRKVTADDLIELSKLFNITPDVLLGIRNEIEVNLEEKTKPKKEVEMRINVPQKNVEKFKQVFLYLLGKVGCRSNVGETVLYKLLYFIDFDYYEKYEEQLTGSTYIKNHHGPTPVEFVKIVKDMEEKGAIKKESADYHGHLQKRYLPLQEADLNAMTGREVQHIDRVIARLGHMNATEISDYSHQDVPWLTTPDGQRIDYEKAFYRMPPYSVRSYGKDDI